MSQHRLSGANHRPSSAHLRAQGFTLVELMVAMAIGLLLLAALVALVVSTVSSRNELDKSSRQIENGRYALQLLGDDIVLAGFIGSTGTQQWARIAPVACPASVADLGYVLVATPAVPVVPALPLPVQLLSAAPDCLGDVQAGTKILLLTRVAAQAMAPGSASANETYVQISTCEKDSKPFAVATGPSPGDFTLRQKDCVDTNLAPVRKAIHRIYFVSSCHECGKDTIPTLKMAEYVQGAMTITSLAEGIENLQFEFGIDTDGNGSPDCYVSDTNSVDAVCLPPVDGYDANIMAVRMHLLARSIEPSGGWTDDRTYDLGLGAPSVGPFKDHYKRHAYSTVARLNNPSGLRELP